MEKSNPTATISVMEYYCGYCQYPKEIWEPALKTYQGDECHLYESFSSLIEDEMTAEELTELALVELPKEFPDLLNPSETIKEMVEIALECGVVWESLPANSIFKLVPNM